MSERVFEYFMIINEILKEEEKLEEVLEKTTQDYKQRL
jgi:hypothetical protein